MCERFAPSDLGGDERSVGHGVLSTVRRCISRDHVPIREISRRILLSNFPEVMVPRAGWNPVSRRTAHRRWIESALPPGTTTSFSSDTKFLKNRNCRKSLRAGVGCHASDHTIQMSGYLRCTARQMVRSYLEQK